MMSEEEFERLKEKAKVIHYYTFCFIKGTIPTEKLNANECLSCIYFVLNGGDCDPL